MPPAGWNSGAGSSSCPRSRAERRYFPRPLPCSAPLLPSRPLGASAPRRAGVERRRRDETAPGCRAGSPCPHPGGSFIGLEALNEPKRGRPEAPGPGTKRELLDRSAPAPSAAEPEAQRGWGCLRLCRQLAPTNCYGSREKDVQNPLLFAKKAD